MTRYPVNFQYDKYEGQMFDGMAATPEDARRLGDADSSLGRLGRANRILGRRMTSPFFRKVKR